MSKKDWKAKLKKITYSRGVDERKMEITPYRDWRIVIVIFFAVLVLTIWFNTYIFMGINSDDFFDATSRSSGVVKFNEEGLAKVITAIDDKATAFEIVKTDGVVILDPSL